MSRPAAPATGASPTGASPTKAVVGLAWRAAAIAAAAAALLVLLRFAVVEPPVVPEPYVPADLAFVRTYDPPRTKVDTMLIVNDGQAWAVLAQDPTFSDPHAFYDGPKEFVYRAQRPALPLLVWATSLGQPGLVPLSLMAWTVLGVGALAGSSVLLAHQQRRLTRWAALTAALPGSVLVILAFGPEPLATALCILGVLWWLGPPKHRVGAVAAFAVAVLARDITLVVPAALGLHQLVVERRPLRELLPLALPVLPLAGWIVSLHARYGHWPSEASQLERVAPPFRGLIRAIPEFEAVQWVSLVLGVVLVGLAVRRALRSPLTWIALVFAAVSLVLGQNVWVTELYRVLLPMYAFALIALLPRAPRPVDVR